MISIVRSVSTALFRRKSSTVSVEGSTTIDQTSNSRKLLATVASENAVTLKASTYRGSPRPCFMTKPWTGLAEVATGSLVEPFSLEQRHEAIAQQLLSLDLDSSTHRQRVLSSPKRYRAARHGQQGTARGEAAAKINSIRAVL